MAKTTDPKTAKPEPLKLDTRVENAFMGRPPTERFLATALYAIMMKIDASGDLLESVLGTSQSGEIDWQENIGGHPLIHYNGKSRAQLEAEGHPPQTIKQVKQALKVRGIKMDEGQPPAPEPVAGEPIHPATYSQLQRERDELLTQLTHARTQAQVSGTNGAGGGTNATGGRSPDVTAPPEPGVVANQQESVQRPATNGPEPVFAGRPLSAFKGMSRDQILAVDGVNPATADRIEQRLSETP